jgi:hypothetical protein
MTEFSKEKSKNSERILVYKSDIEYLETLEKKLIAIIVQSQNAEYNKKSYFS